MNVYYTVEFEAPSWIKEGRSDIYKTREAAERAGQRIEWTYGIKTWRVVECH